MHGNVHEWCADTWHGNYQGAPNNGTAWMNENDNQKGVLRGGSWFSPPDYCSSAIRKKEASILREGLIAIRVALGGVARNLH
jgi:formylglycine-generating enzyme required for sulfatase activity